MIIRDPLSPATGPRAAARFLALGFVLYGLIAAFFLAFAMPPFQNVDEYSHMLRATQIADGGLIAQIVLGGGGGYADSALPEVYERVDHLRFHPELRATREMWAPAARWNDKRVPVGFQAAIYPPFLYAPAAIGIMAGRGLHFSVAQTLELARLATGVTAVLLGALAIALVGGAAPWLFAILTLPMSLSVMTAVSQDGLLLSLAALACPLWLRAGRWPARYSRAALAGLAVVLSLVAMARPPYAALALLPLALTRAELRWRLLAAACIVACTVIWSRIAAANAFTGFSIWPGHPDAQLSRLIADPMLVPRVAAATLRAYGKIMARQFVGWLGWVDTLLPRSYYHAAAAMLIFAAVTTMLGLHPWVCRRWVASAALLISVAGIFGIQYLTWTPVGHPLVEGVQGRYFLPLALPLFALFPALGGTRLARLHGIAVAILSVFPIVSLAVVMHAIILRYYLQ